ncbi:hypothetical protein GCM10010433_13960 [Streptomyces pulveraceus]
MRTGTTTTNTAPSAIRLGQVHRNRATRPRIPPDDRLVLFPAVRLVLFAAARLIPVNTSVSPRVPVCRRAS